MVSRLRWPCLLGVAALAGIAGCKGLFAKAGLPNDPLFLDKKPTEVKAVAAPPMPVPYAEPKPPVNPYYPPDTTAYVPGRAK
jgi:hypothetical protein